jgi:hypothetical protein
MNFTGETETLNKSTDKNNNQDSMIESREKSCCRVDDEDVPEGWRTRHCPCGIVQGREL